MPGVLQEERPASPAQFNLKEIHPTFGAEIDNVKLADLSEEEFKHVLDLMAKARDYLARRDHPS